MGKSDYYRIFDASVRSLDPSPRIFITTSNWPDGIGSQVFRIISIQHAARLRGFQYVHHGFRRINFAQKEQAEWRSQWEAFFCLGLGALTLNDMPVAPDLLRKFGETATPFLGNNIFCDVLHAEPFISAAPILLTRTLPDLHRRYWTNPKPNLPSRGTGALTLAVHIRRGDVNAIVTHGRFTDNAWYVRMLEQLLPQIRESGRAVQVEIYSEGVAEDFRELWRFDPVFCLSDDLFTTFHALASADVLLMAKSYLSYVAALYSLGTKLYQHSEFKQTGLPHWLKIFPDGEMQQNQLARSLEATLPFAGTRDSERFLAAVEDTDEVDRRVEQALRRTRHRDTGPRALAVSAQEEAQRHGPSALLRGNPKFWGPITRVRLAHLLTVTGLKACVLAALGHTVRSEKIAAALRDVAVFAQIGADQGDMEQGWASHGPARALPRPTESRIGSVLQVLKQPAIIYISGIRPAWPNEARGRAATVLADLADIARRGSEEHVVWIDNLGILEAQNGIDMLEVGRLLANFWPSSAVIPVSEGFCVMPRVMWKRYLEQAASAAYRGSIDVVDGVPQVFDLLHARADLERLIPYRLADLAISAGADLAVIVGSAAPEAESLWESLSPTIPLMRVADNEVATLARLPRGAVLWLTNASSAGHTTALVGALALVPAEHVSAVVLSFAADEVASAQDVLAAIRVAEAARLLLPFGRRAKALGAVMFMNARFRWQPALTSSLQNNASKPDAFFQTRDPPT